MTHPEGRTPQTAWRWFGCRCDGCRAEHTRIQRLYRHHGTARARTPRRELPWSPQHTDDLRRLLAILRDAMSHPQGYPQENEGCASSDPQGELAKVNP